MKKISKAFVAFLGGILLILGGCQKPDEPEAPELIAPPDGAVFDSLPIELQWSSSSAVNHYILTMTLEVGSASTDISHFTQDTTFILSEENFSGASAAITWRVATISEAGDSLWSEERSFTIDITQPFDLDTTYFPFGLGYEWCYERHNYGYDHVTRDEEWDSTFSYRICVVDSFLQCDTLIFPLTGGEFRCVGNRIYDDSISIGAYVYRGYLSGMISIFYPQISIVFGFNIKCLGDTLVIDVSDGSDPYITKDLSNPIEGVWQYEKRLKHVGAISQELGWFYNDYLDVKTDRLLYFYNGRDTVYKAPE